MQNDKRFLSIACLPLGCAGVLILCIVMCCSGWLYWVLATEDRYPTLVDEEVQLDLTSPSDVPDLMDWHEVALTKLKAYDWQSDPKLVRIFGTLECQAEPVLASWTMFYDTFEFADGIPSVKQASVRFEDSTGMARVYINYARMERPDEALDLSRLKVDLAEAFALADARAGQTFRSNTEGNCEISFGIDGNYVWDFGYKEWGQSWEPWEITVNAITGETKRITLPSTE